MTKFPGIRASIALVNEATKTFEREWFAAGREGRSGDWLGSRRRELRKEAEAQVSEGLSRAVLSYADARLANKAPEDDSWAMRAYAVARATQDFAGKNPEQVLATYERAAARVPWQIRLEYDAAGKNALEARGEPTAALEELRRRFLTAEEAAFESRSADLERVGGAMTVARDEAMLRIEQIANGEVQRPAPTDSPGLRAAREMDVLKAFDLRTGDTK